MWCSVINDICAKGLLLSKFNMKTIKKNATNLTCSQKIADFVQYLERDRSTLLPFKGRGILSFSRESTFIFANVSYGDCI